MIKKILVADNSITIQKIVAMAFEHEEVVVEGICKGKDALDKMKTFKPDIVLADIDMEDLTGFELSKKIKNDPTFNSTKVLLLASDLESFNINLFDSSGADDHISKPFKSEDIIKKVNDLLSEKSPDSSVETINLTPIDLDVSVEPTETTIELSTEDMVEEDDSTINLSSAELEESIDPASAEEAEQKKIETGTLDVMIKNVESLKKAAEPSGDDHDELSEEVAPTQEDTVGDELDMAFREIVNFGSPKEPDNISSMKLEPISGSSTVEGIIPEPEDLLGEITSSTAEGGKRLAIPSSLGKNSSRPSQVSHEIKSQQATATQENQTATDKFRHPLEDMIHASVERELSELSNSITQSVREIVQEITPKIVSEIVKEEIDKIKSS
jgi:DNA-binding response OmpR family regulator